MCVLFVVWKMWVGLMRKAVFHGYVVAWLPSSPFSLSIMVSRMMFTPLRVCIISVLKQAATRKVFEDICGHLRTFNTQF